MVFSCSVDISRSLCMNDAEAPNTGSANEWSKHKVAPSFVNNKILYLTFKCMSVQQNKRYLESAFLYTLLIPRTPSNKKLYNEKLLAYEYWGQEKNKNRDTWTQEIWDWEYEIGNLEIWRKKDIKEHLQMTHKKI